MKHELNEKTSELPVFLKDEGEAGRLEAIRQMKERVSRKQRGHPLSICTEHFHRSDIGDLSRGL
ncbi:hypothetical protein CV632_03235 [Geobacillus thermodenitrificans]|nr:hypothetical protein GD3902_12685 [Geobacillus thermodenitrificans]PJW22350.1 hypothetical protein CV632_03235 [Geobacillus thermodenitrificans]